MPVKGMPLPPQCSFCGSRHYMALGCGPQPEGKGRLPERLQQERLAWVAAGGHAEDVPTGPAAAPVLTYIGRYKAMYENSPSFRQIQQACDLSSLSLVYRAIKALQDQGYLERNHGQIKAIILTPKGKDAVRPITSRRAA